MQVLAIRLFVGLIFLSLLSLVGLLFLALQADESSKHVTAVQAVGGVHGVVGVNTAPELQRVHMQETSHALDKQRQLSVKTETPAQNSLPAVHMAADVVSADQALPLSLRYTPHQLILDFNQAVLSKTQQLRVLARLMLLPQPPSETSLLAEQGVPLLKLPYFYQRILTPQGDPIRYPYQAMRYAQQLLTHAQPHAPGWVRVKVPLEPAWQLNRARAWSNHLARVGLNKEQALLLAIMEVESGFNPKALSRTGAIGLMQLKPEHAVEDVARHLGASFSKAALWDADTNLNIGAHYVRLLQNKYLAQVQNPQSREYLTIAAYNGGINAVLKQFGTTHAQAIKRINQMAPDSVYRILRYQFPRDETRRYLEKVVQAKTRYQQWIKDNVI